MPRTALFVDVQNIYYTTRQAYGRHFNYQALWNNVARDGEIISAFAYAIDRGDPKQEQFQQILRRIGFTVKLKPYIQRSDGSAKGDWDVGITLDLIEQAETVDRVVLLSGDGDFDLLLEKASKRYGCETVVYGVPELTATSLQRVASRFIPIDNELLITRR